MPRFAGAPGQLRAVLTGAYRKLAVAENARGSTPFGCGGRHRVHGCSIFGTGADLRFEPRDCAARFACQHSRRTSWSQTLGRPHSRDRASTDPRGRFGTRQHARQRQYDLDDEAARFPVALHRSAKLTAHRGLDYPRTETPTPRCTGEGRAACLSPAQAQ